MQLEFHQLNLRYQGLRVAEPGRLARLTASVALEGQREPVLVVADGSGQWLLIDGYLRVKALQDIGRDVVEAVAIEVGEIDALVLTWRLETSRRRTALEDGWLLRELVDTHALTQAELSARMRRSKSWISERLALVRALPDPVQDAVRRGQLPAHAAMKVLVPWARRSTEHCERLVAALGGARLTDRQIQKLYTAWRGADDETRQRIVDHPLLWLKAEQAAASDAPPVASELLELAHELDGISGLCRKIRSRLRTGVFTRGNASDRETASRSWKESKLAFEALTKAIGPEVADA